MGRKKEPKLDTKKAGGFAFFLSLLAVLFLAAFGLTFLAAHLNGVVWSNVAPFLASAGLGALGAHLFIRGHTAVFLHELKHSIISNLAGNKARRWRIRKHTGHFEYEFTEKTRGFNAFIALAPYFLPLFTAAAFAIALAGWHRDHGAMVVIVGFGWGADMNLNVRDIGPHQTDFSGLRGGFPVGLLYVGAITVTLGIGVLTWASWGLSGLGALLKALKGAISMAALSA